MHTIEGPNYFLCINGVLPYPNGTVTMTTESSKNCAKTLFRTRDYIYIYISLFALTAAINTRTIISNTVQ